MQKILYGFIILLVAGVLFFFRKEAGLVFIFGRSLGKSFINRAYNYENFEKYSRENKILKLELTADNFKKEKKETADFKKLPVEVFSNYPFNDRNIIVLNAGLADGLAPGMPVVDENNVILGKIVSVKRTQSAAQTIFDPAWKSAVSIGKKKVKALFKGGVTPQLDLISPNSPIATGDEIRNLSSELPFEYLIGFVENVEKSKDGSWITSAVRPGTNLESIDRVIVLMNFP